MGDRQAGLSPGPVAAGHVGGAGQAEVLQRGGGQAGGVALGADHDGAQPVAGDPGQAGVARRIEAPFQVRTGTRLPCAKSYLVIADSGGEYACTPTATELAEEFRTSCT